MEQFGILAFLYEVLPWQVFQLFQVELRQQRCIRCVQQYWQQMTVTVAINYLVNYKLV